jgi:hypothetical protein
MGGAFSPSQEYARFARLAIESSGFSQYSRRPFPDIAKHQSQQNQSNMVILLAN